MGRAREVLSRRRRIEEELNTLQEMIAKYDAGPRGISTSKIHSAVVSAGTCPESGDRTGGRVVVPRASGNGRIQWQDALIQVWQEQADAYQADVIEAERLIGMVRDTEDRDILRLYYCCGMYDSQIAARKHFGKSTVLERRNAALDWLDERISVNSESPV